MSDKKIWLNFIMKDESKVLLRMLSSVNHIIDGCVCVDTGSTDDSKQIVKQFFEQQGKPCEIYDHPFINFSDARNLALSKLEGKDGYCFWIDCDEQLILNTDVVLDVNLLKKDLKNDIHNIIVNLGEVSFARRNFFNLSKKFTWVGVVHESISFDSSYSIGNIKNAKIHVNTDGNSWSEGREKKYLKHAELFLKEVQHTDNPNPRDVFYLAQSYKDAKEYELAVEWYRKRVSMKEGFYEERYYSQFMIGFCYQNMNKPNNETFFEYMKCSELDTLRAEHILNSIILLQREGLWQTAYTLSLDAVNRYHEKNPYPNRLLFIDVGTYSSKLMNVHNINKKILNKHDSIQGYEINDYSNHIDFFLKLFEYKKFKSVFEYGCGFGSTTFFLDKCERVIALEMQEESWYEKVKDGLKAHKNYKKLDLRCDLDDNSIHHLRSASISYGRPDLVFVDGIHRGDCINLAFELGHKYIVTHDTEDMVYPYGWDKINVPKGYFVYNFKKYRNWTTIFTNDEKLYNYLVDWMPFDNISQQLEIKKGGKK